ncbi:cyclophilin-like fold protein [Streptomyces europaeiscabiei]|uniref:cyclophilin-like fold protein n=1 Tax=Streptomyces europaeiscabiei TaxID=146819 RepID=UPI00062867C6|nr:cyclophilin-like fold protein [Streptomyces europaeiscabiei]MDX3665063.1 cyclophilin-like fold protein [Streptomyces europaeiscabiei]MDX3707719.1 cyclophilin-like fold protein [Streptomyces europaeiscabiei]MDX3859910.1 cyclophilin-like fold protein [Streptomyces europaeiscabiei]MDX3869940.1 cyclophilin-like fold protein [Streptomyces europaeiscabiei]
MNFATRRALVHAVPAAALLLAVTACTSDSSEATPASASSSPASSGRQETSTSAAPSASADRNTAMAIRVTIDGRPVDATLNASPAARDFADLLPLTLDLEDFHQTERIADLPRRLTTSGAPDPAVPRSGDLAYYAPWGNLALYYRDGDSASADLLILGHVDADADRLGTADRITIEAAP